MGLYYTPFTTAQWVAAVRARHAKGPGPHIIKDEFARHMLDWMWGTIVRIPALSRWVFERGGYFGLPHVGGNILAREAWFRHHLRQFYAIRGYQVVEIGSGFSSLALWCEWDEEMESMRVIEVDRGQLLQAKQERVFSITRGSVLFNNTHVPCDLERDNLAELLLDTPTFHAHQPAMFSCLGFMMYLREAEVMEHLGQITRVATKKSRLALTYLDNEFMGSTLEGPTRLRAFATNVGEPFGDGLSPRRLETALLAGWKVLEHMDGTQVREKYFPDHPELSGNSFSHFLLAERL